MDGGVYGILNSANGHWYVGSAVNLKERWWLHLTRLRQGSHHSRHLQNAFQKYGESAFQFKPLLLCDRENLILFEQRAIDAMKPEYNMAPVAGSCLGVKRPGRRLSAEHRARIGKAILGKKRTMETRMRMSEAHRGHGHTPEARAKMSLSHLGVPLSADTRARMSEAQKLRQAHLRENLQ